MNPSVVISKHTLLICVDFCKIIFSNGVSAPMMLNMLMTSSSFLRKSKEKLGNQKWNYRCHILSSLPNNWEVSAVPVLNFWQKRNIFVSIISNINFALNLDSPGSTTSSTLRKLVARSSLKWTRSMGNWLRSTPGPLHSMGTSHLASSIMTMCCLWNLGLASSTRDNQESTLYLNEKDSWMI